MQYASFTGVIRVWICVVGIGLAQNTVLLSLGVVSLLPPALLVASYIFTVPRDTFEVVVESSMLSEMSSKCVSGPTHRPIGADEASYIGATCLLGCISGP